MEKLEKDVLFVKALTAVAIHESGKGVFESPIRKMITSEEEAIILLKEDPRNSILLCDELMKKIPVVLYSVSEQGHISTDPHMAGSISFYKESNKKWLEPGCINDASFYSYYNLLERVGMGHERKELMALVDVSLEYYKLFNHFPEQLLTISYKQKNTFLQHINVIHTHIIGSQNVSLKYRDYTESLLTCAIEKYFEHMLGKDKYAPYFGDNDIKEKTGNITDEECAKALLEVDPRAVSIIDASLLSNWEVCLYLARNAATISLLDNSSTNTCCIDGIEHTEGCLLPPVDNLSPEFYTLFSKIESFCAGCSRKVLIELVKAIITYKNEMGEFPSIPSKDVLMATCDMKGSIEETVNDQVMITINKIRRDKRIQLSRIEKA